jgi:hypothetical protein
LRLAKHWIRVITAGAFLVVFLDVSGRVLLHGEKRKLNITAVLIKTGDMGAKNVTIATFTFK